MIYFMRLFSFETCKASKNAEKVAKSFLRRHNCLQIILHDDFTWKSVRFIGETLRFKREQTREIVHASCLNENSSNEFL